MAVCRTGPNATTSFCTIIIDGTETKHCRGTFIVEDTPTQAVLVTTDLVVEESTVDDGEFAFVIDTTSLSRGVAKSGIKPREWE